MTALVAEIKGKGKGGRVEWGNVWREIRLDKSVIVARENRSGAGRPGGRVFYTSICICIRKNYLERWSCLKITVEPEPLEKNRGAGVV